MIAIIYFTILIEFKQIFFALFYLLFVLYAKFEELITCLELRSVSHYECVLCSKFRVKEDRVLQGKRTGWGSQWSHCDNEHESLNLKASGGSSVK